MIHLLDTCLRRYIIWYIIPLYIHNNTLFGAVAGFLSAVIHFQMRSSGTSPRLYLVICIPKYYELVNDVKIEKSVGICNSERY